MSYSKPDIKAIFGQALEISNEADRASFVESACQGDLEAAAEIQALLEAVGKAGSFMAGPAAVQPEPTKLHSASISEGEGTLIGPYKLMEQIGEGGFGLVFVAEQEEPVRRKVALKIIKPGMDTKEVVARFEAERQALALMDHPNIARIFDGGMTDSGRPYFVMELVKGMPITEYCDQTKMGTRERLDLFLAVCRAVQHAHSKGIIHRDLKPNNILIAPHDGVPVVKVIDFGVSKAIGQRLTDKTIYTRFQQMVGTPLYMSPEQAEINALDVDIRSDVYALGVLLYELLTGSTPFDRKRFATAAYEEIRRIIKEEEPPRPSTRLSTSGTLAEIAATRQTEPAKLPSLIRGELDWIVMKSLEKDRSRRYETVVGMAKDVQRHLSGEAVEACPPSWTYRIRKLVHRHRGPVIAGTLVTVVLLAGIFGTAFGLIKSQQNLALAEDAREVALQNAAKERQARQEESKQRAKAERIIDRTLGILDSVTSEDSLRAMTTQQELTADQRRFFNTVLEYYQDLARESGEDEADRFRAAEAAEKVADIQATLGVDDRSFQSLKLARDGFQSLVTDFPQDPRYRFHLVRSRAYLAYHQIIRQGPTAKLERELRDTLATLEDLIELDPENTEIRIVAARSQLVLARTLAFGSEVEEAIQLIQGLTQSLESFLERGDDKDIARALSAAYEYNGFVNALLLGDYTAAEEPWLKCYRIREKLHRANITDSNAARDLARGCWGLAKLHDFRGNVVEAEKYLRQSVQLCGDAAKRHPSAPLYRNELAYSNMLFAKTLMRRMKLSEAESCFRQALVTMKQKSAKVPNEDLPRYHLIEIYVGLKKIAEKAGQTKEAEKHYQQALNEARSLIKIYEKQLADEPNNSLFKDRLAGAYRILVRVVLEQDGFKYPFILQPMLRAEEGVKSLNLASELVRESKENNTLSEVIAMKALVFANLKQHRQAIDTWEKAIDASSKLWRPDLQVLKAVARIQVEPVETVIEDIEDLRDFAHMTSAQFNKACLYALANARSEDMRTHYADRAMELLTEAVEGDGPRFGPFWHEIKAFDSIRERKDFQQLVERTTTPIQTE